MKVVIAGGGVFGLSAAVELRRRGHAVRLLDPGPIPHPLAASTDISKVVRMEYGADPTYMALAERARDGWLEWNARRHRAGLDLLYHETGVLMVRRDPMADGGFEHDSWRLLLARGHAPERLDGPALTRRFPAWRSGRYVDGFYHTLGGYAESGRVVTALLEEARGAGVVLEIGSRMAALLERGGRVVGLRDQAGQTWEADAVLVAAGAWTPPLVGLETAIRPSGHPVFHLRPPNPDLFRATHFPVFTADIARTGYYGFPLHSTGVVKIGHHGPGIAVDPAAPRAVTAAQVEGLRGFLADTFPDLADAAVVFTRLCCYADTQDEDFWVAGDPARPGLTVASGDSGHGFKFAPVLGGIIADAVLGEANALGDKFRWRPEVLLGRGREAARWHGQPEPD